MEDNIQNELIENGTVNTYLRSGTNRIVTHTYKSKVLMVSTNSKLKESFAKEETILNENSNSTTDYNLRPETEIFNCNLNIPASIKVWPSKENGLSSFKQTKTHVNKQAFNHISRNEKSEELMCSSSTEQAESQSKAYLHQTTSLWWNILSKANYAKFKSWFWRYETTHGITQSILPRAPLHSSKSRPSMEKWPLSTSFQRDWRFDTAHCSTPKPTPIRRSLLSRIFIVIWNVFSTVSSALKLKKYQIGIVSTPLNGRNKSESRKHFFHRLEFFCYQSVCYFLLLDVWILSLFHSTHHKSNHRIDYKKHAKYLFLLLIPPLLLLGLRFKLVKTSAFAAKSALELNLLSNVKVPQESFENSAMKDQIDNLQKQVKSLQAHLHHMSKKIDGSRRIIVHTESKIETERHIVNYLTGLFDFTDTRIDNISENMKMWIKSLLISKNDLEQHLDNAIKIINKKVEGVSEMIQEFSKQNHSSCPEIESVKQKNGNSMSINGCNECMSEVQVNNIVNKAINLYDADKTGMVDYALESGGGTVISIRCTENYNDKSLELIFFGMKFPWSTNHPRIALQPEVYPGRCWAFRGAQGYLVVKLAKKIKLSAFSIEHIPASISYTGNIDAAPKEFSVLGLESEYDNNPVKLGKYTYQANGSPLQTFPVQKEDAPPYQIVELAIESNHGNLEYTCLYRFRVHGVPV